MSRLAPLLESDLTPEQRSVAEQIASGPRGGSGLATALGGPFAPMLRSPELAQPAQALGAYCRYHTSLTPDVSEMVILVTGRHWMAQYEFWTHSRMAQQAGVPDDVIDAIRTHEEPPLATDDQRAAYGFAQEYFDTHRVSDGTYRQAVERFGERGVVDLVGIIGYYGLVSALLNVFEVELPEGETPPLS
ncbi:MAG: carboxymuconolactone decarboxylase family protein [Dehalococcoidia bacterium]